MTEKEETEQEEPERGAPIQPQDNIQNENPKRSNLVYPSDNTSNAPYYENSQSALNEPDEKKQTIDL